MKDSPLGRVRRPSGRDLGLRRIRWVRVVLGDDGPAVCHVMGIGHRLPVVRRVPLATALALARDGVPCLVRTAPGRSPARFPAA